MVISAQEFTGTNAPDTSSDFSFSVASGATNLSLVVSNTSSAWSYLLLKKGGPPTDSDFDFASRLDGVNNQINLRAPEFTATDYGLRVRTPAASAQHAFTVVLTTNRTDLTSAAYPVLKPLAFSTTGLFPNGAAAGAWHYFQVEMPADLPTGWRVVLSSSSPNNPDLYIRHGALPTESAYDRVSTGQDIDTIIFNGAQATANTYFIGVRLPAFAANDISYTLSAEVGYLTTLAWDPGTTDAGTQSFTNRSASGGDYYFKITTVSTANGAWRTALNVQSGEADVYISYNGLPTRTSYNYSSARTGSDGFVLSQLAGQFAPVQDWYILVHATPGAEWSLTSGEAYVTPLPALAADSSSGGTFTMGAEGMRFFKTTISTSTLAWWLNLSGLTNQLLVKKTAAPHPSYCDWARAGQMLLVPSYLNIGDQYFVSVVGNPGLTFTLDSRQQPITDLAFGVSTNFSVSDFGYRTFRVQVPVQQIAWQVNAAPGAGNPNVAVRRDAVPNEFANDAFSEVPSGAADSVTLVPPALSDGTFYITVYGNAPYTCTLTNGQPVITDVDYVFGITNDVPNRVGWRFYRVPNTSQQLGTLGWDLLLQNQPPGTAIALRRSAVPGSWNYRNYTSENYSFTSAGYSDVSATSGYLQQPGHQADIWYIGVYSPTSALGNFVLTGQQLGGNSLSFDGANSTANIVNQPSGRWQYYRVDVPAGPLGWDVRLANVTSGRPQLVMRRDQLPLDLSSTWWGGALWPSGHQMAAGGDLSGRAYDPSGTTFESGRILQLTMGNPLEPGTYYLGVLNEYGNNDPMSYTLQLRGIGTNLTIPVTGLAFSNAVVSASALPPRQVAYYRVVVPSNSPCWRVRLNADAGESMFCLRQDLLPGNFNNGLRVQKEGNELFLLLPGSGQTNLAGGTYYLAVVGEGSHPLNENSIGTGTSDYTLTTSASLGTADLGTLDPTGVTDLTHADSQEGGDIKVFQFTVPPGTLAFEASLENRVGNPRVFLRADYQVGLGGASDGYGHSGGAEASYSDPNKFTVVNPTNGLYTLVVQAASTSGVYSNASYRIRLHPKLAPTLAFDGGTAAISGQTADVEQFFHITVPSDAIGWDLVLTNVSSGSPIMTVCRDLLPSGEGSVGVSAGGTDWPSGAQWQLNEDWTGCPLNAAGSGYENGRWLAVGMGSPLVPGNYFIRVRNNRNPWVGDPMTYTLVSRGIGTDYAIRVQNLAFPDGIASATGLPPRQAVYYRVNVPTNVPSWKLRLASDHGDSTLAIRWGGLPNTGAGGNTSVYWGGAVLQKVGDEQLLVMPPAGQTNIVGGWCYLAVTSQGENPVPGVRVGTNTSSFTLTSYGVMPVPDLGTVDATGQTDLVRSNSQAGGESQAFQFTVPPGTLSLEVRLQDKTGAPWMSLRPDSQLPVNYGNSGNGYGQFWGQANTWIDANLINLTSPLPGVYTMMVRPDATGSSIFADASYTIRLHAIGAVPVNFVSATTVTNQALNTWRYFLLQVPSNTFGWDLRLTNVTSGLPFIVVRRDQPPGNLSTYGFPNGLPGEATSWPSGNQWAAPDYDWTGYGYASDGRSLSGHELVAAMGNPLEPGTYYVGVINSHYGVDPMSYTLVSRGIGPGQSIPIGEIPFTNGVVSNPALPVSEAAYYRVEVPTNTPSWQLKLAATAGDSQLVFRKDGIPNIDAGGNYANYVVGGYKAKKSGNEHFLWLPNPGQTNIPGGTYYLAVLSEGMYPDTYWGKIGTNASAYTLTSLGALNVASLGTVGQTDLTCSNALEGGEIKAYQFTIPPGAPAVEVRLDNRVGNPYMLMALGGAVPSGGYFSYGALGGFGANWSSYRLITLPNPATTNYTLAMQAVGNGYPDASYTLVVHQLPTPQLNFAANLNTNGLSNVATGALVDDQRAYYKVFVPATNSGAPVLGWKLVLTPTFGAPQMRVSKDALPQDSPANATSFVADEAIIVPNYLTPGTWYVEVKGVGGSAYTLTSTELTLKRPAWTMPALGQSVTTPGLPSSGPLFGDTGIATSGAALPGDQGTDLAQADFDYYAVVVPPNNVGLLRTRLDAISGNPNLYLRVGGAPSLSHGVSVPTPPYYASAYDRSLTGTAGSEYGNWVPVNGRYEAFLTPGTWYLAVNAAGGSNVRYRLRLSTGDIQDLALNGGSFANQTLVATDWRYYRVQIPSNAPVNWNLTFSQLVGDVVMYVRDTVPPGNVSSGLSYDAQDWSNDAKNHGPYPNFDPPGTYTLTTPPLRPGNTYYVGFRAVNDATFNVSSAISGGFIDVTNVLDFYTGSFSNHIPANSSMLFRIDVPPDAARWIHTATHSTSVYQYLEQGSLPTTSAFHWSSYGSGNVSLSQSLVTPNNWPWLPGYSWFLMVANTSATPQPFSIRTSGFGPDAPPSTFTSANSFPNGWFQFNMRVNPGWTYLVQVSTNLTDWTTLTSLTPQSDIYSYIDSAAPSYAQRFYRLVAQ